MKPHMNRTTFGSVTIEGEVFRHDVIVRLGGKVKKRKKKLSKAVYGTSHTISLDEAKHVYQKGAERLIVGAGQYGLVAPRALDKEHGAGKRSLGHRGHHRYHTSGCERARRCEGGWVCVVCAVADQPPER